MVLSNASVVNVAFKSNKKLKMGKSRNCKTGPKNDKISKEI